jgi:hypothetical protein
VPESRPEKRTRCAFFNNLLVCGGTILQAATPEQIDALPKNDSLRQEMIQLARVLDDWNNGLIGTGDCGGGPR